MAAEWNLERFHNNEKNNVPNLDEEEICTFDMTTHVKNRNNNFNDKLSVGEYCIRCKPLAKIKNFEIMKEVCLTQDCPGYLGIGAKMNEYRDDLSNDESSDDTPLLFEKSPTHHGSTSSENEFDAIQHCHISSPSRNHASSAKKKLLMASGLCLLFISGEILGGYLSGSLAIMSDAAHMFSDFASFLISLFAIYLGSKKSTRRFTFGFYRAEVLGALMTVMIIWFVTGVLLYLAIQRLVHTGDFDIDPEPMLVVAICAVVFNIVLGLLLRGVPHAHGHSHGVGGGKGGHHSHGGHVLLEDHFDDEEIGYPTGGHNKSQEHINLRAASIHVLGDLIQSIGVLISSVIMIIWKDNEYAKLADPICTVLFSIIVFSTTIYIIKDTFLILLESKPNDKNYDEIFNDLFNLDHVVKVHDLHVWSLTTDQQILTVHLAVDSNVAKKETVLQNAMKMLRAKYQLNKTTIQVEDYKASVMNDCEQCQFIC